MDAIQVLAIILIIIAIIGLKMACNGQFTGWDKQAKAEHDFSGLIGMIIFCVVGTLAYYAICACA